MQTIIQFIHDNAATISTSSEILTIASFIGTALSFLFLKRPSVGYRKKKNVWEFQEVSCNKSSSKPDTGVVIAVICFFGFLSLTAICATICVVVYFITR